MKSYWIVATTLLVFTAPILAQPLQQTPKGKQALEVLPRVKVTVLEAHNMPDALLLREWSGAFLVETDNEQILFDNGSGHVLLGNARALNVDLSKIKAIVISHEHGDHTYGLDSLLNACGRVELFVHPAGFNTRYWKLGSRAKPHTLPLSRDQLVKRVRGLVETKGPTRIGDGLRVTGQIPRVCDFEDTGVRQYAFLDKKLTTPDPFLDDQAVFFRVPEGVVVVLGCGHAGLINTVAYVSELTGEKQIYAVIGGTHLLTASPDRLKKTAEALRKYNVQKIMFSLRPNVSMFAELASVLPGHCTWPGNGQVIKFGGQ